MRTETHTHPYTQMCAQNTHISGVTTQSLHAAPVVQQRLMAAEQVISMAAEQQMSMLVGVQTGWQAAAGMWTGWQVAEAQIAMQVGVQMVMRVRELLMAMAARGEQRQRVSVHV